MEKTSHSVFDPPIEQPAFYKGISELEAGDRIWIEGSDLAVPLEGARQKATVLWTRQINRFAHNATICIDGAPDATPTQAFDIHHTFELASLEGQRTVWVAVPYIKPGHVVHWMGQDAVVEAAEREGDTYFLTLTGLFDRQQKRFNYTAQDELRVKIVEPKRKK